MVIDGRAIAADILSRVKARADKLPHKPKLLYYAPLSTPATQSYLSIKKKSAEAAGCLFEETKNPVSFEDADAAIVQLPLPEEMDTREVCNRIPLEKDADVLSSAARSRFMRADIGALLPPVVGAIKEILEHGDVSVLGKQAVVIGDGFLVGMPTSAWLAQQGASTVTVRSGNTDLPEALLRADIIVCGAGSPHLVKPNMLKKGVVLIDAGTSELEGDVVGDADPACEKECALFTPVPGGVGPIAVAKLFENVLALVQD